MVISGNSFVKIALAWILIRPEQPTRTVILTEDEQPAKAAADACANRRLGACD